MAGEGARFQAQGYTFPKPLIEIKKTPLIQIVAHNITPREDHRFTFICRKVHYDQYALQDFFDQIAAGCSIVQVFKPTAGAACTVLLACEHFHNDQEMLIVNGDQYIEADINHFLEDARTRQLDGSIMTFPTNHPKWSYAKVDNLGYVTQVAEKRPISRHATVGIYYYRTGRMFFDAATAMIQKNIRVGDEFYVCPAYNETIAAGLRVGIYEIPAEAMHGLGTPEDLQEFEKSEACRNLRI